MLGSGLNALGHRSADLVGSNIRDTSRWTIAISDPSARPSPRSSASRSHSSSNGWSAASRAASSRSARRAGRIDGTLGLAVDITERKQLETQLTFRAFHDSLTGLANRALFRDRVTHALSRVARGEHVAVVFLDLDDFKTINDSLGHTEGDHLLEAVAARLLASVRSHDTVARFGGDEFAILLQRMEAAGSARSRAPGGRDASKPVNLRGREVVVSCSIGLAHAMPGDTADEILRNADVAMYRAKDGTRERHTSYLSRACTQRSSTG